MDNVYTPRAEPGTPDFFLEVAERIGGRVARQAIWQEEGGCTWQIMSPDRDEPGSRTAKAAIASGTLYEGTAGVGLFLAELHAATGGRDPEVRRAAEGALRFALADGTRLPDGSFGFHGGRVGIAYAAVRGAHLLGVDELRTQAEALLEDMVGKEQNDRGLDVIAGAAGAIPALLRLPEWGVSAELAVGIARRLGENLMETAERETGGWAWGTMRGSSIRHLCGYAHGSAGAGHGMLELYRATGDAAYLYGMEQAFLYERRFFSAEASNWPDLRHSELGDYLYQNRNEELKERLLAGNPLAPQAPRYMAAWCHGAPGIGLSRLRAWAELGDPLYLEEAQAAIVGTRQSLVDPRMNYSLCHGQGGNAETLVYAAEVLDDPALRDEAAQVAVRGWELHEREGKAWPCGTLGGVLDPGLLLGESGIGYFFLRLGRPETPSVVFVAPETRELGAPRGDEGYHAWRRRSVDEHLGRTLRAFADLGEPLERLNPERGPGAAPVRSDVEIVHDNVEAHVAAAADPDRRELLEDAFRVDRERYDLGRSVVDFTEDFTASLIRRPEPEVQWQEVRLELSPRARVVHTGHDWDGWLEREGSDDGLPEEDDVFYLVQAAGQRVGARRLSPFAAAVLQSVEQPATLDEVVDRLMEAVSGGDREVDRGWVEDRVLEQLRQAYRAGFVGVEVPALSAA
jgi:hypothetical protein